MLPSHGNHTEEDEEQDRDEAAPCRGAGLGARDRGGSVAAWGCREGGGGSAAAESGEQQPEGVARATRQHSEAFIIFAWARPLSCVIWSKMDGRSKM